MKLNFKYSHPLDRWISWKDGHKLIGRLRARKIIARLEKAWKKEGRAILGAIARITGAPWRIKVVSCYIVGGRGAVSEPLIITWRGSIGKAIDTLTHELIHINISQKHARKRIGRGWDSLMKKYQKEEQITKTHIVVHAIHEKVILTLYGKRHLTVVISRVKDPLYRRAWEIVERDGADNIVLQRR